MHVRFDDKELGDETAEQVDIAGSEDYVQKGVLDIQFIDNDHQWADIFTKPLTVERFNFIKKNLNMHFVSE